MQKKLCSQPGCSKPHLARGYCLNHYRAAKKQGEFTAQKKEVRTGCSVDECLEKHFGRGFCEKHYKEDYYHRNWDAVTTKNKAYAAQNRETAAAYKKRWYQENHTRILEQREAYYQANADKVKAKVRDYAKKNPDKVRGSRLGRKKHVRKATPKWANQESLRKIYETCPPGHHVDHIVPLRGKLVSGLHVPENLRQIPATENLKKNARFDFDSYYEEYLADVYRRKEAI